MITRFAHLPIGRSPGGLRPSTLISLGLTFSTWISRTSGSRNVGSICGIGALTEIWGAMSRLAAPRRRIVHKRRRLFGMRMQQRFDRKDVVRIGVFQCWRGLHWRSLAQSNVTRIGRRACFAAWKTLCPESLVQAATRPARFDQSKAISWRGWGRGFQVLEPERRKREAEGVFLDPAPNAPGAGRVLERNACDVGAMPGVPFRAGAAHVVALGTIGVAGALDQAVAARHDRIEAAEQRHEGWIAPAAWQPLSAVYRGRRRTAERRSRRRNRR